MPQPVVVWSNPYMTNQQMEESLQNLTAVVLALGRLHQEAHGVAGQASRVGQGYREPSQKLMADLATALLLIDPGHEQAAPEASVP
jgi:hypothetical protein